MKCEWAALAAAIVLGLIQILLQANAATAERGLQWNLSPRDGAAPPLSAKAARIDRALQNFKETFPLFVAAIMLVTFTANFGKLSEIGAWTYVAGRVIYLPLMVFGVVGVRSAVWFISVLGVVAVLIQAFLHAT